MLHQTVADVMWAGKFSTRRQSRHDFQSDEAIHARLSQQIYMVEASELDGMGAGKFSTMRRPMQDFHNGSTGGGQRGGRDMGRQGQHDAVAHARPLQQFSVARA